MPQTRPEDVRTDLLVIGAGPYGYAAAAHARDRGIRTHVVGEPMSFWREQMPDDMFLRSGPDWHLDASGEHTFAAYFEERGLDPVEHDPVPIGVFLDHTDWFAEQKHLDVDTRLVTSLVRDDGGFTATLADGATVVAEKVLAAPGIRHFTQRPDWADGLPDGQASHTCDLVAFDDLAGARVVVVGGRQSAYEWAALLCDRGAARVDVVHRHETPRFEPVSWSFVDPYVELSLGQRGWWRHLSDPERRAVAGEFWRVGRLTLEPWLVSRLDPAVVTSRPGCTVVATAPRETEVDLTLSDGTVLTADHVVLATGYRAALDRVPYLAGVLDDVAVTDGFPVLDEGMQTTLPGLFVVGFASTNDFGPFYGFTKGCPSAARIAVGEMLAD
jgi:cation diffusion facilitator CzcD-associated flavoprotein CzcO